MSELEIQENMSAEEAFMDTESAYEEIPEAFQKLAQLLGQDQFELLFPDLSLIHISEPTRPY